MENKEKKAPLFFVSTEGKTKDEILAEIAKQLNRVSAKGEATKKKLPTKEQREKVIAALETISKDENPYQ